MSLDIAVFDVVGDDGFSTIFFCFFCVGLSTLVLFVCFVSFRVVGWWCLYF